MRYSKITGVIAFSGGQATLREGQSIDEDHPLVVERPELFREGDEVASTPNPRTVETTMQNGPGGGRVRKVAGQ